MIMSVLEEKCVVPYAGRRMLVEKHPGSNPCDYCVYHKYGCPNQPTFEVNSHMYMAIEQSADELPKQGIYCKKCRCTSGKIKHETLWNGRNSYFVSCPHCGSKFLLYKERVQSQYTGFVNGRGDFVHPDPYNTGRPQITPGVADPDPFLEEIQTLLRDLEASMSPEERRALREEKERQRREANEPTVVYSTEESHKEPTAMELAMRKAKEEKERRKNKK